MSKIRASQLFLTLTAACALALTACGGGGGSDSNVVLNPKSRTDEGIWTTSTVEMQAVILGDGSYWGIYGSGYNPDNGTLSNIGLILHGASTIDGNNVSGVYSTFTNGHSFSPDYSFGQGIYTGIALGKSNINLTFNDDPTWSDTKFELNYDIVYDQPIQLATLTGKYLAGGAISSFCPPAANDCSFSTPQNPNLIISGANLTLYDGNGVVAMTGTISPHGTTTSIFDVSLATTYMGHIQNLPLDQTIGISSPSIDDVIVGTVFNGILFQTSIGQKINYIEIVAASEKDAFYFMGSKQD